MESLLSLESSRTHSSLSYNSATIKFSDDELVIQSTSLSFETDRVSVSNFDLPKSLLIKGQKIVEQLNELLKADLPGGLQSLKPEEVTPEATADRIVKQTTAFFDAYAEQNPELEGEELLNKFMDAVRSGVQKGYDEAYNILDGLGAFDFEGVRDGVEMTKALIESKLDAFESAKRKELGLEPTGVEEQIAASTEKDLLALGGSRTLSLSV